MTPGMAMNAGDYPLWSRGFKIQRLVAKKSYNAFICSLKSLDFYIKAKKTILAGLGVFLAVLVLTQLVAYQQYLIYRQAELDKIASEANIIRYRLKSSLSYSLSATKTLAFYVERNGVPKDFDAIARDIMLANKFVDAVQLTREGVITHVYPYEGNSGVIGYDVLSDTLTRAEALQAVGRHDLYFAGPLTFQQGGTGVVGRLPIFRDGVFWGFAAVVIRLPTLLQAAGIDMSPQEQYSYQISKKNADSGKEEFFLPGQLPVDVPTHFAVEVPDGEWRLYVLSKDKYGYLERVIPISFLGFLFSIAAGLIAAHYASHARKLRARVHDKDTEMETLQKQASNSYERVNRLFHFVSRINHLMVHVKDEHSLFSEVCHTAVHIGKFRMAWIGLVNEAEKKIFPASYSGDELGYLSVITPIPLDRKEKVGPSLHAIRSGLFVHCGDIATDPLMKPWAKEALSRGYRSSILLPIHKDQKVIGSFNLYSEKSFEFDENEINLLVEVANNISFTLENFEKEKRRQKAEHEIIAEKILSDSIINSLPGIFYLFDRNGKFLRWNKNFETVSGYSAYEIRSTPPLEFVFRSDKSSLKERMQEGFRSGYVEVLTHLYTKKQEKIPYLLNGKRVNFDGVDYLMGMGLDVTDRLKAERDLHERTEEIRRLSVHLQNIREEERSRIALEIHDVLGQQLTAVKMDAAWIAKRIASDDPLSQRMAGMIGMIDETIMNTRRISSSLHPSILDDLGLVAALEWHGTEFEKNTGISVKFETNRTDLILERDLAINVFRIYQEALTNVARHSHATKVRTVFRQEEDMLHLKIYDNGVGINVDEAKKKKSLGLVGMKERAHYFGGEVTIEETSPNGSVVTLKVPLKKNPKEILYENPHC